MGKRGPKSKFTDVVCPNVACKDYGVAGAWKHYGLGTYQARNTTIRRYICHSCGKAFCDSTNTVYYNLRKDESTIDLALNISMKGMSNESTAEVLRIQPATIKRWLALAAKQCDKVNVILDEESECTKDRNGRAVGDNKKKVVPRMEVYEDDGPWMWVAFAPDTRLIVAFTISPRKQYVADELVRLTDDCLSKKKPVFVTDGLDFYNK